MWLAGQVLYNLLGSLEIGFLDEDGSLGLRNERNGAASNGSGRQGFGGGWEVCSLLSLHGMIDAWSGL